LLDIVWKVKPLYYAISRYLPISGHKARNPTTANHTRHFVVYPWGKSKQGTYSLDVNKRVWKWKRLHLAQKKQNKTKQNKNKAKTKTKQNKKQIRVKCCAALFFGLLALTWGFRQLTQSVAAKKNSYLWRQNQGFQNLTLKIYNIT